MEALRSSSSIVDFSVPGALHGGSPEAYLIHFRGRGLWYDRTRKQVLPRESHEVSVQLGAAYPRLMPELTWRTPIFHPNISSSGVVCLGGYGTHWVPSLQLDRLCEMLWDMIRYQNYDVDSPYNREAALWAKSQREYPLPCDLRPLRDRAAGVAPSDAERRVPPITAAPCRPTAAEIVFLQETEIVDAEIVEPEDPDILFIE